MRDYDDAVTECKAGLRCGFLNFRFEAQFTMRNKVKEMKLSLKVEYACQVLAQLGYTVNRAELPHIEDLARAEAVPSNYLVQILNELRTAGLIVSRRGKQGGYALARNPGEITLYDIIKAVDGTILAHSKPGEGQSSKKMTEVWESVAQQFGEMLKGYTVEDFMTAQPEKMWYI